MVESNGACWKKRRKSRGRDRFISVLTLENRLRAASCALSTSLILLFVVYSRYEAGLGTAAKSHARIGGPTAKGLAEESDWSRSAVETRSS